MVTGNDVEESKQPKDPNSVTRWIDSVYVTIAMVVLCIMSSAVAVSIRAVTALKLLPLLFALIVVVSYIINRLFATPRRLVVWQVLVSGFWLGWMSALTLMLVFMFLLSENPH
jgi:hypothetical protein